jgi:hypothetical protein
MNTVEETKADHRVKVKKRVAVPRDAASKQTAQPSIEEKQIAEMERTFTDRWEW